MGISVNVVGAQQGWSGWKNLSFKETSLGFRVFKDFQALAF